jgi:hypothetical protein
MRILAVEVRGDLGQSVAITYNPAQRVALGERLDLALFNAIDSTSAGYTFHCTSVMESIPSFARRIEKKW